MSIAHVYFGEVLSLPELTRMNNTIEYPNDFEEEEMEHIHPGKYKTAITNILSKHQNEIKTCTEEVIQNLTSISKKKLKDLVQQHNHELFQFMCYPEKLPAIFNSADTILQRFGQEPLSLKVNYNGNGRSILKDLNLDVSLDLVINEFNKGIAQFANGSLDSFIKQLRWMITQYKVIGEDILRLETALLQKIETLDQLNKKITGVLSLVVNEELDGVIQAFSKYAESIYRSCRFEDTYRELIESYKKWTVCRQIISLTSIIKNDNVNPQCTICLMDPITHVLVPCGHTYCGSCCKKQIGSCYICRKQIRERIRIYLA